MIALKCETDFVAKNADFVALTQAILDAAVENKCKTIDEIKALPMGNATIGDAIVERSGVTGEKLNWMAISSFLALVQLFTTT